MTILSIIPADAIQRGTPKATGTYAVWLGTDTACYAARFYLVDHGWLTNLKEPLPDGAEITGWIGPMPLRPMHKPAAPAMEYDL